MQEIPVGQAGDIFQVEDRRLALLCGLLIGLVNLLGKECKCEEQGDEGDEGYGGPGDGKEVGSGGSCWKEGSHWGHVKGSLDILKGVGRDVLCIKPQ